MEREILTESLYFRHACKLFDNTQKIESQDLHFILEAGRLSPSSFGMEPWHFIIIQDTQLRAQMQPLCWNQPQIIDASELLVITAKVDAVANKEYYKKMFARRQLPVEKLEGYLQLYQGYLNNLSSLHEWSARQCYIAAANMMSYASLIGIDSCPIEGFEKEPLEELLNIDVTKERIALLIAFGYRVGEASPKLRLSFDEVVSFR